MKIMIYGNKLDITPAIRTYIEDKIGAVSKMLTAQKDQIAQARVEIARPSKHRKGAIYYAELNLSLGNDVYRGESEDADIRTAIDKVRDEVKRQLRKAKAKTLTRRKK